MDEGLYSEGTGAYNAALQNYTNEMDREQITDKKIQDKVDAYNQEIQTIVDPLGAALLHKPALKMVKAGVKKVLGKVTGEVGEGVSKATARLAAGDAQGGARALTTTARSLAGIARDGTGRLTGAVSNASDSTLARVNALRGGKPPLTTGRAAPSAASTDQATGTIADRNADLDGAFKKGGTEASTATEDLTPFSFSAFENKRGAFAEPTEESAFGDLSNIPKPGTASSVMFKIDAEAAARRAAQGGATMDDVGTAAAQAAPTEVGAVARGAASGTTDASTALQTGLRPGTDEALASRIQNRAAFLNNFDKDAATSLDQGAADSASTESHAAASLRSAAKNVPKGNIQGKLLGADEEAPTALESGGLDAGIDAGIDAAAAAEGGLNPIADLVALIAGIGSIVGATEGTKKADLPQEMTQSIPSAQFGI